MIDSVRKGQESRGRERRGETCGKTCGKGPQVGLRTWAGHSQPYGMWSPTQHTEQNPAPRFLILKVSVPLFGCRHGCSSDPDITIFG